MPSVPSHHVRVGDAVGTRQWIAIEGAFLLVEHVVPGKRGDPYDGIALCKLGMG